MKKIIPVLMVLFCMSLVFCSSAFADEAGEDGAPAGSYATSEAYREASIVDLFKEGKILLPEDSGLKAKIDEKNGGLMISGTVHDFEAARIEISASYNFDEKPVGRVSLSGLSDKKVRTEAVIYTDTAEEPFARIPLKPQMGKIGWKRESKLTASVLEQNLVGEHSISFAMDFDGLEDTAETSVLLRSIEFAESSLPVMYFNIDETLGTIAAMNADETHNTECYGSVDIEIPGGYTSEFSDKKLKTERGLELEYIRGRGNSTWYSDKKPYKLKFDGKQNLLGMGKNKHWILLANRYDNSLIRNRMTYWLTRELSKDTHVFAPECVPVEVVMNGEYYGSYLLTEQIRVGKERVNIDDLEEDNGPFETKEPEISGGYLLSKETEEDEQALHTARGSEFYIESPDFSEKHSDEAKKAQKAYIADYLQKTEESIFGKDFKDPNGKSYSEYMDVPAAVDFWWIQEFSENGDAYGNGSTYLYKERDKTDADGNVTEKGRLYWGPLWDFDYVAWGDLSYGTDPEETLNYTTDVWMNRLKCDPAFVKMLQDRWPTLDTLIGKLTEKDGIIDRYANEARVSEQYDVAKYGFYGEDSGDFDYGDIGSIPGTHTYDTEIEQLRDWIEKRRAWVGSNLDAIAPETFTVKFKAGGKVIDTRTYYQDDTLGAFPAAPKKKGYTLIGWRDPYGDYATPEDNVYANMVLSAVYVKTSNVVKPKDIFFSDSVAYAFYSDPENGYEYYDEDANVYETQYTLMPVNSRGKIKWSSSDKTVGTVDSNGKVTFYKKGKIKITATLPSGKKKSYTLLILDENEYPDCPETEKLDRSKVTLKTGGYTQLKIITEPTPCEKFDCTWISTNTKVVSIYDNGVIVAKQPGSAYVFIFNQYSEKLLKCKVTVKPSTAWKVKYIKKHIAKVKAKALKRRKARITWSKVRYASGYYIFRATRKNGKYKKVKVIRKAGTRTWTQKRLKKGRKYFYKVRPFIKSGKKSYAGKWSKAAKVKARK